jgi:RNA polymerase sigma factor (sigma-70 family)
MGLNRTGEVVALLYRGALLSDGAGLTDGQLLDRYLVSGDQEAFTSLVRRHGPMVLGVCRRILENADDADDAFQATFLVLVRKATSVIPPEMVANFLYGVACRTARKARALAVRRKARERQVTAMPEPRVLQAEVWDELRPLLDKELALLPDRYRAPMILCDLEGKTHREAARQLGWPQGTVSGRLARARALLARRLARHGLTLSATGLGAVLGQHKVSAAVPAALARTASCASLAVHANLAATTVLSARAITIAEGVLKTMAMSKINLSALMLFLVLVASLATRAIPGPAQAQAPRADGAQATAIPLRPALDGLTWSLTKVDAPGRMVSVAMVTQAHAISDEDLTFANLDSINNWNTQTLPRMPAGSRLALADVPVSAQARVTLNGKASNLARLKQGMVLSLKFAEGVPLVNVIDAHSAPSGGDVILKSADPDARTITVSLGSKELTLGVAPDALIFLNTTGKGEFKDLAPGLQLSLTLGVDGGRIAVKRLLARPEGS